LLGYNVNAKLDYFKNIIPCGIENKSVTSLNKELGVKEVNMDEVKEKLKKNFSTLFGCNITEASSVNR